MNVLRSFKKSSFKEFINGIKAGDLEKVKNTFDQEFINKRILDEPNGLRPIHVACESNSPEVVKYLIDRGCDFEQRTNESLLPIHVACISGSIGIVDLFLKKKNQLEVETKEKYRPIHYACKYGHIDIVLMFINHKCHITSQTIYGYTPLHLACEAGMVDIVKILLAYHCPIDIVSKDGLRPIDLSRNNKEIIMLLAGKNCIFDFKRSMSIESEVDVSNLDNYGMEIFKSVRERNFAHFVSIFDSQKPIMSDPETKMTLMEYAISEKAYEFVETILKDNVSNEKFEKHFIHFKEKNADIFDRIIEEYTIYRAIRFNFKHDLKSISIINQNCILTGTSFFELAVKYNSSDYVGRLMTKLITRNEIIWNKAKNMAKDNLNCDLYKLIDDREKYLETRDKALWTRLHIAVDDNDIEMVKHLLKMEPEALTDYSACVGSPLNLAAICGRIECLKLLMGKFSKMKNSLHVLIKNGMAKYCFDMLHCISNINEADEDGNTLLHLSAKFLCLKLVEILLDSKADPNIKNSKGNTPLHEMLSFNIDRNNQNKNEIFSISELLLNYKTIINLRNNENKTLFQHCLQWKNVKLILLLLEKEDNIEITREDLQLIMDNNWNSVLEIIIPRILDANDFIDKELLIYFLKNRSVESFISTWYLADSEIKKECVCLLLLESALTNKASVIPILCEETECDNKLFDNGETLLTSILKNDKQDFGYSLINSNLSWAVVNQKNSLKETPLHVAARNEYFGLLENMLYIAEDINQADKFGNTPFSILINLPNQSEEVERLTKLIISKIVTSQEIPNLNIEIENCQNQDLKLKLSRLYKMEMERKMKITEQKNVCNVCLDNVINISFDCGHTSCKECSVRMKVCPICRKHIKNRNALFL